MTAAQAPREAWLRARLDLLAREKALTQERDAIAAARRALPLVPVEREYRFVSERGEETLGDLFDGRSQLAVYHFMFGQDWQEGCPSCSFWADNMDGTAVHLAHRDTMLVLVSNAPFEKLDAYRRRMGWKLRWVSAGGCDFSRDLGVSWREDELDRAYYNHAPHLLREREMQGISTFWRDRDGGIFHAYSTYARGVEEINGAYHLLDMTHEGRQEPDVSHKMEWVRRHDAYAD